MQQATTAVAPASEAAEIADHLAQAARGMRNGRDEGTIAVDDDDIADVEDILRNVLYETGDIALDDLPEALSLVLDGMTVAEALENLR